jgi:hypothetical protein
MAVRFRRHWEAHFLSYEAVVPIIATLLLILWAERLGGGSWLWAGLEGDRAAIYSTAASLAGALLGFVLTTATIVSGVISLPAIRRLRSSSQYPTLWAVFGRTLRVLAGLTAVSLIGLIADRDSAPLHWVFYVLTWLASWGAILLARTIWILEKTLNRPGFRGDSSDWVSGGLGRL